MEGRKKGWESKKEKERKEKGKDKGNAILGKVEYHRTKIYIITQVIAF